MQSPQMLLEDVNRKKKARELTLKGINEFNEGNIGDALLLFEDAMNINPLGIENTLYHILCNWAIVIKELTQSGKHKEINQLSNDNKY